MQEAVDAQAERVKAAVARVNPQPGVNAALERAGLPPRAPVDPKLNLMAELQLRKVGHTSEDARRALKESAETELRLRKSEAEAAASQPQPKAELSEGALSLGILPGMSRELIIARAAQLALRRAVDRTVHGGIAHDHEQLRV